MSAFDTNLIAITWLAGKYQVVSQVTAQIDVAKLEGDGYLRNVSRDSFYRDEAAVVQAKSFESYLLPESRVGHADARSWYASLPPDVMFILIHRAEWESGMGG